MRELSLHILDIVQNAIVADSSIIEIIIDEQVNQNKLQFLVKDNGKGMDEETLRVVVDPFHTSRTSRKVGLGIPLLKEAAEQSGGGIDIVSKKGVGTTVKAWFEYNHIDRAPLGSMVETMQVLILSNPDIDFVYKHQADKNEFIVDTREIKKVLAGVAIDDIEVVSWLTAYLDEGINSLYGGASYENNC